MKTKKNVRGGKLIPVMVALVLSAAFVLSGCTTGTPEATPTTQPTVEPTLAPTTEPTTEPTTSPCLSGHFTPLRHCSGRNGRWR